MPANVEQNPEINIGTGTMDRSQWKSVVNRFIDELRGFDFCERHLDVRENINFTGGHFAHWVHTKFPDSGCVITIEVKKFYMDEWTGKPDTAMIKAVGNALKSTTQGISEELKLLR